MSELERKPVGKKYNDDFKKTIVDLYHSGSPVKELSSEYGESEVTIYKWVKDFTPIGSEKVWTRVVTVASPKKLCCI